ncbi:MAG TPA: hypothetical protein VN088_13450 [Nocardioides sp.]|nr:hypothetical protein [Nocardioides sp.]
MRGRPDLPMRMRHLISLGFCLLITPIALALLDFGADDYMRRVNVLIAVGSSDTVKDVALIGTACVLLVLVTACGRISGLGPVVAGVLYGVLPFAWFVIDNDGFLRTMVKLPSTHLWFEAAPYELPLAAVLLVGAGVAGRWGPPPATPPG